MDGNCNGGFQSEQRAGDFVASQPIMSYAGESLLRLQDVHAIPCSSANGLNPFLSSVWNPLVTIPHHHPVDSPIVVGSFDVLNCNQVVTGNVSHCNYPEEKDMCGAKMAAHLRDEGGQREAFSEEKIPSVAVERKRKRIPDAGDAKDYSSEKLNNVSHTNSECSHEKDEQHQVSPPRNSSGKQIEEQYPSVDAPKEDYIHHVRAKRGQATNSHSLAERVRREKISERMKFLQDLVPGCNKVIGKAVMLDEIINYVQSLQRQVEFLSMKLAAVNPDLDFDMQHILSKEVLNARGTAILGNGGDSRLGASNSHLFVSTRASVGISPDPLQVTNAQISAMPQTSGMWDEEIHGIMQQMDFANKLHSAAILR